MKQLTLTVPDNKYSDILNLLQGYDYIEISEEQEFEIPEFHKHIIDKRLENIKSNPDCLLDWEDVRKEIEESL
jgi:hypothetical protein